jgi:Ricin-type beta-trefoil lectin domain
MEEQRTAAEKKSLADTLTAAAKVITAIVALVGALGSLSWVLTAWEKHDSSQKVTDKGNAIAALNPPLPKRPVLEPRPSLTNHTIVSGQGMCLDVDSSKLQMNGGQVQIWTCNNTVQQRWMMVGAEIKSGGGKCLDVDITSTQANGAKVQVWDCNGQSQQQWEFDGKQFVNRFNGRCLDVVATTQLTNGTKVQTWDCNQQPQQTWRFGDRPLTSSR